MTLPMKLPIHRPGRLLCSAEPLGSPGVRDVISPLLLSSPRASQNAEIHKLRYIVSKCNNLQLVNERAQHFNASCQQF